MSPIMPPTGLPKLNLYGKPFATIWWLMGYVK